MALTGTSDDVARGCGITDRQVRNLANDGVLPKPIRPGEYDIAACCFAYWTNVIAKQAEGADVDQFKQSQIDLRRAQEYRIKLDIAEKQGEVVPVETVRRMMANQNKLVADFLEDLPDTIERKKNDCPPDVLAQIRSLCDHSREQLYVLLRKQAIEEGAGSGESEPIVSVDETKPTRKRQAKQQPAAL